jgi:hypothetical protein
MVVAISACKNCVMPVLQDSNIRTELPKASAGLKRVASDMRDPTDLPLSTSELPLQGRLSPRARRVGKHPEQLLPQNTEVQEHLQDECHSASTASPLRRLRQRIDADNEKHRECSAARQPHQQLQVWPADDDGLYQLRLSWATSAEQTEGEGSGHLTFALAGAARAKAFVRQWEVLHHKEDGTRWVSSSGQGAFGSDSGILGRVVSPGSLGCSRSSPAPKRHSPSLVHSPPRWSPI